MRWHKATLAAVLLAGVPSAAVANTFDPFHDFRALWVTRWDYRNGNAATVQTIMDNAASLGISDVLFQVRGQSDAYYDSQFEPRAEALPGTWDPLQVAINAAHGNGMKLHAWINSMPLWAGTTPPDPTSVPEHIFYHTDPSFRIYDAGGNPQPLNSSYVIANPILPEWQSHVGNVAADIVANYDVDGLHLDYIRWVGSTAHADLPHDDYSHQLFYDATGLDASQSSNAEAYRTYIRGRITDLVRDIDRTIDAVDPDVALSAAVRRDPDLAYHERLQDYRTWLEQNLLDIVMPMVYLSPSNNHLFEPALTNVLSIPTHARVAPGIGVYLHDPNNGGPEFTVDQLQTLHDHGTNGAALYAYSSFFASGALGVERQTAVKAYLDSTVPPPGGVILQDDFESYADTAAMQAAWNEPPAGAGTLATGVGNPGQSMVHPGGTTSKRLFAPTVGTDNVPLVWEFDFHDDGSGNKRLTGGLRDNGDGEPLHSILEMGRYNDIYDPESGSTVSGYGIRTVYIGGDPGNWVTFEGNPAVEEGWHHFSATIRGSNILFELDLGDDGTVDGSRLVTTSDTFLDNGDDNEVGIAYNVARFGGPSDASSSGGGGHFDNLLISLWVQQLGDVNRDRVVDNEDIDLFIECLLGGPYQIEADMNRDGKVNGRDVELFVTAVEGGSALQTVPEPSTAVLLAAGLVGITLSALWRRRVKAERKATAGVPAYPERVALS